jgi:hypothetical protein
MEGDKMANLEDVLALVAVSDHAQDDEAVEGETYDRGRNLHKIVGPEDRDPYFICVAFIS